MWTGVIFLGLRCGGDLCEHDNYIFGSIKGEEFLDYLSYY
jgi:hypothetical protein